MIVWINILLYVVLMLQLEYFASTFNSTNKCIFANIPQIPFSKQTLGGASQQSLIVMQSLVYISLVCERCKHVYDDSVAVQDYTKIVQIRMKMLIKRFQTCFNISSTLFFNFSSTLELWYLFMIFIRSHL